MRPMPELRVEMVPVDELVPYAHNAKEHPREQVEQIARSIEEFGDCDPIAVWHNEDGKPEIVEGHGRLLALKRLGIGEAPTISLDHLTDEQRRMYTHVHNQTTLSSGWDEAELAADLDRLADEFDAADFGFVQAEAEDAGGLDERYSQNVGTVDYEPSGRVREPWELYDRPRPHDEEIEALDAPPRSRSCSGCATRGWSSSTTTA